MSSSDENEAGNEYPKLDGMKIDWNSDFMSQMYSILKGIKATDEQKREMELIKDKLIQAISPIWPDVKISNYGSSLSGPWLSWSDLDMSVDSNSASFRTSYHSTIGAELSKGKDFSQPKEFRAEGVLILHIIYIPTNRHLDITFNNEPAKATTDLIAAIMDIDNRVLHLTLLVKFWAKVHGLGGRSRMTSVIVYTLVIFYLQQEGLIPSVASMLDNSNYRYLNGWNMAIKKTHADKMEVRKSHLELLGGFFEYYENFSWQDNVVSIFSGTIHHKNDFLSEMCEKLPDIFTDYKRYVKKEYFGPNSLARPFKKYAYIQDPLLLSNNLAVNFDRKNIWYMKTSFAKAAECYRDSQKTFLKNIFTRSDVMISNE